MSISHHPFINLVLKYTDATIAFTTSSGNLYESSITLWLKKYLQQFNLTFFLNILRLFPLVIPIGAAVKNLEQSTLSKPRSICMFQLNLHVLFSVPVPMQKS